MQLVERSRREILKASGRKSEEKEGKNEEIANRKSRSTGNQYVDQGLIKTSGNFTTCVSRLNIASAVNFTHMKFRQLSYGLKKYISFATNDYFQVFVQRS